MRHTWSFWKSACQSLYTPVSSGSAWSSDVSLSDNLSGQTRNGLLDNLSFTCADFAGVANDICQPGPKTLVGNSIHLHFVNAMLCLAKLNKSCVSVSLTLILVCLAVISCYSMDLCVCLLQTRFHHYPLSPWSVWPEGHARGQRDI